MSFRTWRQARVRLIEPIDGLYVRLTPNFGLGLPWFRRRGVRQRVRYARHHGLQVVVWQRDRWVVSRQLLGTSHVKGERYAAVRHS